MQYDYERFTPDRFQEFCQALLVREYKGVQCYPVGQKDGGRDAMTRPINDDSVVFQVKFKRDRLKGDDPYALVKSAIDQELPKVKRLADRGATRYVLMTNLAGSSALDVGAMDKAQKYVDDVLPIPGQVWWRLDLDARLHDAYDLRWVFSEIVTSSDMLRMLVAEGLGDNSQKRLLAITGYLTAQYELDEYVKFKQADLQASDLLSLFIDVPVSAHRSRGRNLSRNQDVRQVIRAVIQDEMASEQRINPSKAQVGGATLLSHTAAQADLLRVVIEGAPGQGKSTLAQYVCQVQRMRFLGKDDKLSQLPAKHRLVPARVPFKVDLRDLSSWLRREDPISGKQLPDAVPASLESFLAAQVTHFSGGQAFAVEDLTIFLSKTPSIIVLDGLDEVATMAERKAVIEAVSTASARIQSLSPLTQMVVTTRPAAVANTPTFSPEAWDYLHLESITEDLIYEYTNRWSSARKISVLDVEEIKRILRLKLSSTHVKDLARNAMQLTILLNLVHVRGQALPDHRTELYDKYIDVFFNREADKNKVVLQNRQLLIDLHGFLAWKIHAAAESRRTNGRVTHEVLRELVAEYLTSRAYPTDTLDDLLAGVVQRIVALVSRVEGTFEFEVQPLREYFAARHLYDTAPYSPAGHPQRGTKPEIFEAIAPNPFWLNVTRFYAGCYSVGELSGLADQVEDMVTVGDGAFTSFPRAVATSLMADRVFNQAPRVSQRVAALAVDQLTIRFAFQQWLHGNVSVELSLPVDCGMEEAVALLLRKALTLQSGAGRRETAVMLRRVAPLEVLAPRWLGSRPAQDSTAQDFDRWLEVGAAVGVVPFLSPEEANALAEESDRSWSLLVEGGHPALTNDPSSERRAIEAAADQSISLDSAVSPLGSVGWILNAFRYEFTSHGDLFSILDVEREEWGQSNDPSLSALTTSITEVASSYRGEFDSSREPWDRLIREFEEVLGRTWLSWRLAVAAAARQSLVHAASEEVSFFASNPLDSVQRAREKRSDPRWWETMAFEAQDELSRRAWLLLYLRFANPVSLRGSLATAETICEELTPERFHSVVDGLGRKSGSAIPSGVASELTKMTGSARLRLALATRFSEGAGLSVGSRLTDAELARDPVLADMYLGWIMGQPTPRGAAGWRAMAKEAARVYKFCADPFVGISLRAATVQDLPPALAKEILSNCDNYPASLIALADRVLSAGRQAKPVSVASIARRGRWAAN